MSHAIQFRGVEKGELGNGHYENDSNNQGHPERGNSSKPLKHSIVKHILVFER